MSIIDPELFTKALAAIEKSYSPYSKFPVGCALKTKSGQYYSGCNIENASYSLTQCAEASAIAQMVSAGEREIAEIFVIGDGAELCTPCGACRQRIREFASLDTPIHIGNREQHRASFTLNELLPHSFGPENLEKIS